MRSTFARRSETTRDARLLAVVADAARRRVFGESLPDAAIIEHHPELMPELADRLRVLAQIEKLQDDQGTGVEVPLDRASMTRSTDANDPTITIGSADLDASAPDDAPPADLVPGYALVREISRGGQGVVYEAWQEGTKRRVAIKVLHPAFSVSESARRRFEREVELVATLRHPHIVSIFHIARTTDGRDGYVMDFVEGTTLRAFVRAQRLRIDDCLRLFADVCDAVQFAHQNGIIHRDLKPSNILVDADGQPRLMDFGLARTLEPSLPGAVTRSDEIVGTLPYMSPEQTRGGMEAVDTRSDVYSLGVVLYELLTGRFPYPVEAAPLDVLRNIGEAVPVPPARAWSAERGVAPRSRSGRSRRLLSNDTRNGSSAGVESPSTRRSSFVACPIGDEVETIVMKALAKERERRYQSAGQLAADVRNYLSGEPIDAKRDSAWYVLRKYARRHAYTTATAICVLTIFFSAVVISLWYAGIAATAAAEKSAKSEALQREMSHYVELAALVQRWQLGWFLAEWSAGHEEAAKRVRAMNQLPNSSECAVMDFLMSPEQGLDDLAARLPARDRGLAQFANAERERKAGRIEEARRGYEASLESLVDPTWRAAVADRLREIENP